MRKTCKTTAELGRTHDCYSRPTKDRWHPISCLSMAPRVERVQTNNSWFIFPEWQVDLHFFLPVFPPSSYLLHCRVLVLVVVDRVHALYLSSCLIRPCEPFPRPHPCRRRPRSAPGWLNRRPLTTNAASGSDHHPTVTAQSPPPLFFSLCRSSSPSSPSCYLFPPSVPNLPMAKIPLEGCSATSRPNAAKSSSPAKALSLIVRPRSRVEKLSCS